MTFLQPVVSILDGVMKTLYSFTHDWGLSIVVLTLLIRSLLFKLNLSSARQQVRSFSVQPILSDLRTRYASDPAKLIQKMTELNTRYGIKPFMPFGAALIQMPIFMSLYPYFTMHGAGMTSLIVPWMQSLGISDPSHLLPYLYGLLSWIGLSIPLLPEQAASQPFLLRMGLPLLVVAISTAVMWRSPAALVLYWSVNGAVTLAERIWYRTPAGRKLLYRGVTVEHPDSGN
ncbi:YidC/Oxa1 family membrane protein insertase [Paenibacillus lutrae]|uniref:Membrane protein insertase YidC n=1 Tax=Paenibacillus lutrae TaxID=2078573 RepID=A0A7X3FF52_9BACL|nr:membrane protein insertase YidC [Paenibacillus lutrae]MVO98575.1 membrane protein insertase YidC [Paenibacillus lutrae]